MKKILLIVAAIITISCGTQKATVDTPPPPPPVPEAPAVKKITPQHLSGIQTKASFDAAPFTTWFQPRYDAYQVDDTTLKALEENMQDVKVRAYMGTWCGDSKRETPKFYKLMNDIGFKEKNITLVTVDRSKKKPVELVEDYNIIRVPTFIFYRDGQEIGRFVERPMESLEKDILKIVSGQPYKHYYDR